MADKAKEQDDSDADRKAFRRQVAIALASAYISKHGGFGVPAIQEGCARQIWAYAELLVSMEDAPEQSPLQPSPPQPKGRAAHPSDEWGVIDAGGKKRGGFITESEAMGYATGKAGSRVVQISGPEVQGAVVAPASLPGALSSSF